MLGLTLTPDRAARLLLEATRQVRVLGDVSGHEFHGNQWSVGGGKEITQAEAQKDGALLSGDQQDDVKQGHSVLMRVPIANLAYNDEPFDASKPKTAERVARFIETIQKGQLMLALDGYLNTDGKVEVSDGHHRLAALKATGKTHAVVTVAKSSLTKPWKVENGLRANEVRVLGDQPGHEFHGNQWTGGGAAAAVDRLKDADDFLPLKHFMQPATTNVAPLVDKAIEAGRGSVRQVDISTPFKTEQEIVGAAKVKKILEKTSEENLGTQDLPRFAKNQDTGELTLTDGNHRVVAELLKGSTSIKAMVVSLPAARFKTLGDVSGHEFHGNQWTGGSGGAITSEDKKLIENDWAWPDAAPDHVSYHDLRDPNTVHGKRMTEVLNKLPVHDGVTYRGVSLSDPSDVTTLLSGKGFKLDLHSSASTDLDVASDFMDATSIGGREGPVILELHGRGRDINEHLPEELQNTKEVVLMAGTRYRFAGLHHERETRDKKRPYDYVRIVLKEVR